MRGWPRILFWIEFDNPILKNCGHPRDEVDLRDLQPADCDARHSVASRKIITLVQKKKISLYVFSGILYINPGDLSWNAYVTSWWVILMILDMHHKLIQGLFT